MNCLFETSYRAIRVEICGGIAAGKTTLATLLTRCGFTSILEDYEANPFLRAFYLDRSLYAFETEVSLLLQHYHQVKKNVGKEVVVCDFSFHLDLAYSLVTLEGAKLATFRSVLNEVTDELRPPQALVFLRCGADTLLRRIRARGRREEGAIDIEYLDKINDCLIKVLAEMSPDTKLVPLDSDRLDFASDPRVQGEVISLIERSFGTA